MSSKLSTLLPCSNNAKTIKQTSKTATLLVKLVNEHQCSLIFKP